MTNVISSQIDATLREVGIMNHSVSTLSLRAGDQEILKQWACSTETRSDLACRARIVSLASEGMPPARIAAEVGMTTTSVRKWCKRYAQDGLAGLNDAARSGRPKQLKYADIVAVTLTPPPKEYGATRWSTRLLAQHLKIGHATVARAWQEYGIRPWKAETFTFSTNPDLVDKTTNAMGLHLTSPENPELGNPDPGSAGHIHINTRTC